MLLLLIVPLLGACSRGPGPIHVAAIDVADGALSPPLREAGLDEAAVRGAARDALQGAGFVIGDGDRLHRALVSVPSIRFIPEGPRGGPHVEVAVEIALAPAQPGQAAPRRETGAAAYPLAEAVTPRQAWLGAFGLAARSASEGLSISFAAERKTAEGLLADLAARDPRAREHAIRVLGERRSREAVPALLTRLDDAEPRLAHRAVAALAQIGDERAVPALIELSRSGDPALAGRLVRYIGDIGGAEAEGYLLTIEGGHPDPRIRAAARQALDEMSARAEEAAVAVRR